MSNVTSKAGFIKTISNQVHVFSYYYSIVPVSSLHYSLLFWCWTFDHLSVVLFLLGDQSDQKLALQNIASMVRPGGMLIIDHRNYDYILETGRAPQGKNIYYKVLIVLELWAACYDVITHPHLFSLSKSLMTVM